MSCRTKVACLGLALVSLASPARAIGDTASGPMLRPGDRVEVTVFNHPELSETVPVASDGTIALPVIGNVAVANATTSFAGNRIRLAYAPYLHYPAVGVRVVQQGQSIFVTGAFVGVLPYQPGETVNSAIGALRSSIKGTNTNVDQIDPVTTAFDLRNVRVEHVGIVSAPIDVEQLNRIGSAGPAISPGDRLLISDKPVRVDVRGDIKNPGPVFLYPGETLAQALDEAGGLGQTSSTTQVALTRAGRTQLVSAAGSAFVDAAQNDDVITLRPAPRVTVLGLVSTPGQTALRADQTLVNAIYNAGGPAKGADLKHVQVIHRGVQTEYNINKLVHGDLTQNPELADGDSVIIPPGRGIDPTSFLEAIGAVTGLRYVI